MTSRGTAESELSALAKFPICGGFEITIAYNAEGTAAECRVRYWIANRSRNYNRISP